MNGIPAITAEHMASIDDIMRDHYGVEPIQLMEIAGLQVATCVRMLFASSNVLGQEIAVLAGSGGNGGDALVAARFLASWGARVTVVLSRPGPALAGLAARHLHPLERLHVPVLDGATVDVLPDASVIIDGLLGFSTKGPPRGTTATLIELANANDAYVLAIDVPSGMNATTGTAYDPCIAANGTVTLGLPKTGIMRGAAGIAGSLVLVDIGIPPEAYARIGISVPRSLFAESWLLTLRESGAPWRGGQLGR